MKKLIALLFCLAVVVGVARAEYPNQKADLNKQVSAQVNNNLRVAEMMIYAANDATENYTGKAVILKVEKNKIELLLDAKLTEGVDLIDQVNTGLILGKLVNGVIKTQNATALKVARSINIRRNNRPENLYVATLSVGKLEGNNAHNASLIKPLDAQAAVKLLK